MRMVDIALTDDGDLYLKSYDEEKDLMYAHTPQVLKQGIMARLKTQNPDWYTYPSIGANLEDFIGEPNTEETANSIKKHIIRALTYDDFIGASSLEVYPVPLNRTTIIFYIVIERDTGDDIKIPIPFDLNEGIIEAGD